MRVRVRARVVNLFPHHICTTPFHQHVYAYGRIFFFVAQKYDTLSYLSQRLYRVTEYEGKN